MDLQDPTCGRWQHRGIQGKIRSMRLLTERRHILQKDICTNDEVHFHYIHTYRYEMGDTSADIKTVDHQNQLGGQRCTMHMLDVP